MTVSAGDEYPVHQTADWIRHSVTSDRNFYDRNYFNLHGSSDEVMVIFGMGQYPNLGVHDAFLNARRGPKQHVVRASRPLTDRMDTAVGPLRIEVIEPLERVRFVCDPIGQPNGEELTISMNVTWQASCPAIEEPNQFIRREGRVLFDTKRFAQLGTWEGTLTIGEETFSVTTDRWQGSRDRSWGVRPIGEKEPVGIHVGVSSMGGMWNYMPMRFDDHVIIYMLNEEADGTRPLVGAKRVWFDRSRPIEQLGRPEHDHTFVPGTRMLSGSIIRMPEANIEITCEPLCTNYVSVGTGYGLDDDWRHGMYQGPELVVQGLVQDVDEIKGLGQYALIDHAARFTYTDPSRGEQVGYGLYEHGFFGAFPHYGMHDRGAVVNP